MYVTLYNQSELVQQMSVEMSELKNQEDKLEASIKRYTGEDLSSLTQDDMTDLEKKLEHSISMVRERKVLLVAILAAPVAIHQLANWWWLFLSNSDQCLNPRVRLQCRNSS